MTIIDEMYEKCNVSVYKAYLELLSHTISVAESYVLRFKNKDVEDLHKVANEFLISLKHYKSTVEHLLNQRIISFIIEKEKKK